MVSRTTLTAVQTKIEPEESRFVPVAAAYYPAWAVTAHPPEKLDFSKFDIIFFGMIFCFYHIVAN